MKDDELKKKVRGAMCRQCRERGFAAAPDVLLEIGALSKAKHEDWRFEKIDFLERACTLNLRQLSLVLSEMASCAQEHDLKPSWCCYKQWGVKKTFGHKRPVVKLRFCKSGNPDIERAYATHYVDSKRTAALKATRASDDKNEASTSEERAPFRQ